MRERKHVNVKTRALLAKGKMSTFLEEENRRISQFMDQTVSTFTDESSRDSEVEEADLVQQEEKSSAQVGKHEE